jgi:D-alanyl-lipoteichoic acid acyltransferase DltB (MBOAT superfamily)
MLQGLFKKVVIADRLALVVDQTYADLPNQSTGNLFLASVFYSFQIYCDFSGYSDMAIGAAKVMGFDLMKNFNAPYLAKSIPDFWRRWHISLSTWFKDYVYFSLGGNRVSVPRWYLNIMIVFLISGIWHGASWNFVMWGALHGFMQLIGLQINRYFPMLAADSQKGLMKLVYQIWTFLLVNFAWIFFRLQKFSDIKLFFKSFLQNVNVPFVHQVSSMEYLLMLGLMGGLWWMDYKKIQKPIGGFWVAIVVSIVCIYLFGIFNVKQFIYFQF